MYKGPMDKIKGGKDGEWEVGESHGFEMETALFEQDKK